MFASFVAIALFYGLIHRYEKGAIAFTSALVRSLLFHKTNNVDICSVEKPRAREDSG